MVMKCKNLDMLRDFVVDKYGIKPTYPTATHEKYDFECGLVMNIFPTTGNVNFQGDSHESRTASDIMNLIDIINR